jgi:hypothetical protein
MNRIAKLVGLAGARASGEALSCSLFAEGQSQGSVLWFRLLHRGLLGALLCAALGKPGRVLPQSVTGKPGRSFTRVTAEFPLPGRLLKYWSGSRVEADGRRARSERGASPQRAVTRERRRPLLVCLAPDGLRRFWRCPALLAGPRSLRISALLSRLDQRQNRQQRGPLQYFNSLLRSING